MKEIILYKISVTRPTFTARRWIPIGVKEIGGYAPGPIAPAREGWGGILPGGGTGGCAPDEIGI